MGGNSVQIRRMHSRLPVFRLDRKDHCILYTPGQLVVIDPLDANDMEAVWQGTRKNMASQSTAAQAAEWIGGHAKKARDAHRLRQDQPFTPICLTLYLSNQCNMRCAYCFAAHGREAVDDAHPVIDLKTVTAAAKTVADNCALTGKPFQLVIHGGGEPTLHWELIQSVVRRIRQIAQHRQIEWRSHIATNGMLSAQRARWLGRHFHSIGLSCDGPPDIQDRQRPLSSGGKSSGILARTAAAILTTRARLTIRATITPASYTRQTNIVEYVHHHIGGRNIRFEPAYRLDNTTGEPFTDEQADAFVEHFIRARHRAQELGSTLSYSGLRADTLHGPHCNVLRNVLHLTPDGTASPCFFRTGATTCPDDGKAIGQKDPAADRFSLDQGAISQHRQNASQPPLSCRQCINHLHCTYGCPDRCAAVGRPCRPAPSDTNGFNPGARFRCRVNRRLAERWICDAADRMIQSQPIPSENKSLNQLTHADPIDTYLKQIPAPIDSAVIGRRYNMAKVNYDIKCRKMPDPLWVQRDFDHDGERAWDYIKNRCVASPDNDPISIYVHVPFCRGRCGFCDCLTVGLQDKLHRLEKTFTNALLSQIGQWSDLSGLSDRKVTTVHFGGGTPNCIQPDLLENIVNTMGERFQCGPATEWAIESTVRQLTPSGLVHLKALGVSRLHVGVQTLNDSERHCIEREHDQRTVRQRLAKAMEMGFITSVDIIYGLPDQSIVRLIQTLDHLIALGIHGISLYRLNRSHRNERFFKRLSGFKPDVLMDYIMLQSADQHLARNGYVKNHFCHYALPLDKNLYANHAARGEDLVALGPTADGMIGPYHFRHCALAGYHRNAAAGRPTLQGGLLKTEDERRSAPLCNALLSARLDSGLFRTGSTQNLLDKWVQSGLIEKAPAKTSFILSGNGSWLVKAMQNEVMKVA